MATPKTLQQAIQDFSDEQVCVDAVAAMRWPDGPRCPTCHFDEAKNPYYLKAQKRWKCRTCRKQFSVKVGTIFEDSPVPLTKWMPALWMLTGCKNGVSSWELHRALGVSQKTAWFMLHRLRLALKADTRAGGHKLGGKESSGVEIDETFVGGKVKNMHRARRLRFAAEGGHTGGATGKTIVMGMLDRDLRQIRAAVVPNVKRKTLQSQILKHVLYGSTVYTDQAVPYDKLSWHYLHKMVNHMERYVDGQIHTNGLENFWSLMKRSLKGTYVAVEPFHLERYVDEQVFRYNNRATKDNPLNDSDRFLLALSQVGNKRLTYKELTGKEAETEPF